MAKCCGKDHDTNYCPNCGRQLITHPLTPLMAHCMKHATKYRDYVTSANRKLKEGTTDEPRRIEDWRDQCQRAVDRWGGWVKELRRAIANDQKNSAKD